MGKIASSALAAVLLVGLQATPAEAYTAQCRNVSVTWPIQEGAVNINTGMVDVTGRMCSKADGTLDRSRTSLSASIRTTSYGSFYMGASYWKRGYSQIRDSGSMETWRFYGGYQSCFAVKVPLCSPEGYFYFDVSAIAPRYYVGDQPPGLGRSAIIQNQNYWADVRWS